MAEIDIKYATLKDPETCPIDDLKKQVAELENLVNFYDTKQLAIKKFINSVYGALGSKYFVAHNTAMAESITSQGRDLNHFSENSVNKYFKGLFQSNPKVILHYQWVYHTDDGKKITFADENKPEDYYIHGKWEECAAWVPAVKKGKKLTPELKSCLTNNSEGHCDWFMTSVDLFTKLGMNDAQKEKAAKFDISKGMTRDYGDLTGEEFSYLDGTRSLVVGGDTDSLDSMCEIDVKMCNFSTENEEKYFSKTIEECFNMLKYMNNDTVLLTPNGSEVVPVKYCCAKTFDTDRDKVVYRPINYIMRHKVSKAKYKITTESGKEVIVTGDHSCMVIRNNELITIKANEINKDTDKILTI